jgi:hypothetical protein
MDTRNMPRNVTDDKSVDTDFDFYLKSNMSLQKIMSILKAQKKNDQEIEMFITKLEHSRKRIKRLIKKFIDKIEVSYGHLDVPELIKKGIKFAAKHEFSDAERKAFIDHVLGRENVDKQYTQFDEIFTTDMAKFLGIQASNEEFLNIKPTDHRVLDEIYRKFTETRFLHNQIKNHTHQYTDCAPEAILGDYDKNKHNIAFFIHPVIVALFLPKIPELENRMIYTNIGRIICQRAESYLKNYNSNSIAEAAYFPGELERDYELAYDIARDPNSLSYFSDDQPISNLLKRFTIQIKLWENILSLRQGKYYSTSGYNVDEPITGLVNTLNSYDWAFYDNPDLYQPQDEGTILRKLLAVFSYRPTFTQTSPPSTNHGVMGFSNIAQITKNTFVNMSIINVRLPTSDLARIISLKDALQHQDLIVEHKIWVQRNKLVIYTQNVAFFYVNRKFQNVGLVYGKIGCNFSSIPTMSGISTLNENEIDVPEQMAIGNQMYIIKSVVILKKLSFNNSFENKAIASGSAALIVQHLDNHHGGGKKFWIYNPESASTLIEEPIGSGVYRKQDPICSINEHSYGNQDAESYTSLSRKSGVIYVYVRLNQIM